MSDEDPNPYAEEELFKIANQCGAIAIEWRTNPVWIAIREAAEADEEQAMNDHVEVNPTDVAGNLACIIRIKTARSVVKYVLAKIAQGHAAERAIIAQEAIEPE